MSRLLKFIIFSIAGLVVALVVAAYVLLAVIDPNRYRGAIQSVVLAQTGLQAELAGEMSWTFRPTFGLELNDVRLSAPENRQELASFSSVALNINPAGLFSGQLNIEEFSATNLHVNWFIDNQGNSNWPMPEPTEAQPAPATETNGDASVDLNINRFDISNASIDYRNATTDQNFSLRNISLQSRNSNFTGQSFPLTATVRMINEDTNREIAAELDMGTRLDLAAGTLSIEDLTLALSPLRLTGELHLTGLNGDNLRWRAQLASNTFNMSYLLENFVAMDQDAMPSPDTQQISIQDFRANGDNGGATVTSVDLRLNDTSVSGRADVLFAVNDRPMMIGYSLQGGNLNLDDWLTGGSTNDDASPAPAEETELPFDLITDINFRGEHQFDSLTASGFTLSPLQFNLLARDGVMQLETQEVGFYDGSIALQGQVNANQQPPQIELNTEMSNVSATAMTRDFPQLSFFTGRFNLTGNHTLAGSTTTALINSVDGATQLQVEDSSVDITMIKEVFTAISVLNPEGNIAAQWPDVVRFTDAELLLMFNQGLAENQELSLRLDNLDINGNGGLNLAEGAFDYRMSVTMLGEPATQSIPIQEKYQNIAWPVRCEAEFTDAALQYCRPDLQEVRDVFADMARNAVEQRANEVITEQVDRLRNRIQDFFQQD